MIIDLDIIKIIAAFVLAGIISFFVTPLVKIFATRVGAIDVPKDERRVHKTPIPRLGGMAIFIGFICAMLAFCEITSEVRGILLGSIVIIFVGIIDDIVQLKARYKLMGQIFAAVIPIIYGVRIDILTNFNFFSENQYLSLGYFAIPITLIWIVGITNAVNLIDGLDGLAVGVSSIASITLLFIALFIAEPQVAIVMAAVTVGCVGFIPYNFNPAKIFMGDTGAMFLGYILATISIQGLFKFYAVISFAVPFLILGLPIFDTAFAIVRRTLKGQSPMTPDRGHLHHRLIDMGFSQKQTVAILYTISAVLGLSAVIWTKEGIFRAVVLIISVLIVSFIAFKVFEYEQNVATYKTGRYI
jgi:UDP-GlcNAc:undecaprenyl-phosphate GlcNAc-1-phosphate transferase